MKQDDTSRLKKIGIVLPNWIGDVVMATPTLRAIRHHYGADAEIAGIMRPYVSEVLQGTPWLDRSIYFDRKSTDSSHRGIAVIKQLRHWRPDAMVLLTNSLRAGAMAWLSGAKQRIGYDRNGRGALLSQRLKAPRESGHWKPISPVDYYLELAYALGCEPESPDLELATLTSDEAIADRVWHNLRLDQASRIVIFNTGSAVGTSRDWPIEHYAELATRIVDDPDTAVLVVCGPRERSTAAAIESLANHPRVTSMAEQDISLSVAKACIRRSQLMVTTDSGPRHIASAFDVPLITLFGPIDYRWTDSRHPLGINLQHHVDCRPCGKSDCPLKHHRCMTEHTVDRVYAAVQQQLARTPSAQKPHQSMAVSRK
jgi:lipopolysaccharide heptosyltransferase II